MPHRVLAYRQASSATHARRTTVVLTRRPGAVPMTLIGLFARLLAAQRLPADSIETTMPPGDRVRDSPR
jgi:hypothetical protein